MSYTGLTQNNNYQIDLGWTAAQLAIRDGLINFTTLLPRQQGPFTHLK